MDTYDLPLVKKCVDKSSEFERNGDKENAEKYFKLAMLAEQYYSKQNYKTVDEYYKDKHGT